MQYATNTARMDGAQHVANRMYLKASMIGPMLGDETQFFFYIKYIYIYIYIYTYILCVSFLLHHFVVLLFYDTTS